MAPATACAYAYDKGARTPPPPLMPAAQAKSSPPQISEPPFHVDDRAVKPPPASLVPPPPPPPPPPLLRSSIFSRQPGLCTEGLGSESSGEVELDDLINDVDNVQDGQQGLSCKWHHRNSEDDEPAKTRITRKAFPPPISVIGAGGKPWLYLRRHQVDGHLVLREVRIPSHKLLQARREDGRLKLYFAAPQPEEEEQIVDVHE